MRYLNLEKKICGLICSLIIFFIFYKFYSSRPIILGDEFINIAERDHSFRDIMDYSLRPLYRFINIIWINIFGKELESLLIGSRVIFVLIVVISAIFIWRISKNYLVLTLSLSILFISPELLRIGLGALPQIYSGLFLMMYGIFFYLKIDVIYKKTNEFFYYNLLSYLCVFLALTTHPTMFFILVCSFIFDIFFLLIIFVSKQDQFILRKYLKNFFISCLFLFILIFILELIYLFFQDSLPQGKIQTKLSENWTFINLWYRIIFEIDTQRYAPYFKSFFFYINFLYLNHLLFFLLWIFSIGFSLYSIFQLRKNFNDITIFNKYIFSLISIFHILILSIQDMKLYYVLAAFAPAATLSIIFALKEIANKHKFSFYLIPILLILVSFELYNLYSSIQTGERHPLNEDYVYVSVNKKNKYFQFNSKEYLIKDTGRRGERGIRFCQLVIKANNLQSYTINSNQQVIPENSIICIGAKDIKNTRVSNFIEIKNLCQISISNKKYSELLMFKKC